MNNLEKLEVVEAHHMQMIAENKRLTEENRKLNDRIRQLEHTLGDVAMGLLEAVKDTIK